jgi:hypothetical protein
MKDKQEKTHFTKNSDTRCKTVLHGACFFFYERETRKNTFRNTTPIPGVKQFYAVLVSSLMKEKQEKTHFTIQLRYQV